MENTTQTAVIRLIESSIHNNNHDFILLIKTALETQLIDDSLAKIYFISGLHKGFLWNRNDVLIQHAHFRLNAKVAGYLYFNFLSINIDNYILENTSKNISYFDTVNQLMDKFKEAFDAGIIFPQEFFTDIEARFIQPENIEEFKKLNKKNLAIYLNKQLPDAQKENNLSKI